MFGRFTWRRFLGAAGLSVYGVALVAYTLLPLPDPSLLKCGPGGSTFQAIPFQFLDDIQRETSGLGITGTLTSRATLQVVFNVVLFIPWGVIARRYLSWNIAVSTLTDALASGLIEATQFTGLWGLYDCAYRLADVDDLITNALGALIGALIAPLVLWFMPQRRELRAARGQSRQRRRHLPHPHASRPRVLGVLPAGARGSGSLPRPARGVAATAVAGHPPSDIAAGQRHRRALCGVVVPWRIAAYRRVRPAHELGPTVSFCSGSPHKVAGTFGSSDRSTDG